MDDNEEDEMADRRHPLHDHNPWANINAPDPDEDDISDMQWRRTGPNRMSFQGTFTRTMTPRQLLEAQRQQDGGSPLMDNFAMLLGNILGGRPQGPPGGPQGWPQEPQAQLDQRSAFENPNQIRSAPGTGPEPGGRGPRVSVRVGGGQGFTWTTTMRHTTLNPRDPNHPQPQGQNFDDLPNLLQQMFGAPHNGHGGPQDQGDNPFAHMGPVGGLLAGLLNPANMQHGDAVYSQEALDRIVSQMMEQNTSGNAPGPASSEAIASLPLRTISEKDMADSGRAECSICMDEVSMGEQVTELPCHHWFHGECVKAWLSEHDTCPQCRQGIMPKDSPADAERSRRPDEAPRHDQMWGQGEGSRSNPYRVSESPERQRRRSIGRRHSSSAGPSSLPRTNSGNDGLLNRMRNAFGGGGGASS